MTLLKASNAQHCYSAFHPRPPKHFKKAGDSPSFTAGKLRLSVMGARFSKELSSNNGEIFFQRAHLCVPSPGRSGPATLSQGYKVSQSLLRLIFGLQFCTLLTHCASVHLCSRDCFIQNNRLESQLV